MSHRRLIACVAAIVIALVEACSSQPLPASQACADCWPDVPDALQGKPCGPGYCCDRTWRFYDPATITWRCVPVTGEACTVGDMLVPPDDAQICFR